MHILGLLHIAYFIVRVSSYPKQRKQQFILISCRPLCCCFVLLIRVLERQWGSFCFKTSIFFYFCPHICTISSTLTSFLQFLSPIWIVSLQPKELFLATNASSDFSLLLFEKSLFCLNFQKIIFPGVKISC